MKRYLFLAAAVLIFPPGGAEGQTLDQLRTMQASGDVAGARAALAKAVETRPNDVAALTNYAEFLQHYGDPACKDVYQKLLVALRGSGETARAAVISRRVALMDLATSKGTAAPAQSN